MNYNRAKRIINNAAQQMPSVKQNNLSPIETLSIEDINYLQKYLEQIKKSKMGTATNRDIAQELYNKSNYKQDNPDMITSKVFGQKREYNNPYEYGAKQDIAEPNYLSPYYGDYMHNPELIDKMALRENYLEKFPRDIRNVNIETSLLQQETTHLPGQRKLTERETDRFNLLPFDPQDHRHILWQDNMPRGGYATRTDRLELC